MDIHILSFVKTSVPCVGVCVLVNDKRTRATRQPHEEVNKFNEMSRRHGGDESRRTIRLNCYSSWFVQAAVTTEFAISLMQMATTKNSTCLTVEQGGLSTKTRADHDNRTNSTLPDKGLNERHPKKAVDS